MSSEPRPFIRWAGSKRRLASYLVPHLPTRFGRYFEPFLGSGSLFFLINPDRAVLNDACTELMNTYEAVAEDASTVADIASSISLEKEKYYAIRESRSTERLRRAAEFLYLNHGCWNGLYRVNSSGKFNVPWGAPKSSFVVDHSNLLACQKELQQPGVRLSSLDFEEALKGCRSGDLVFLDPPYVTSHNNNGFIDYNEKLFSWADQVRLAERAEVLRSKGVHVIVTNAYHQDVIALYPRFNAFELRRSSTLAGAMDKRGRVSEAILVGKAG